MGGKVLAEGRPIRTANYREEPDIPPDFREVALAERFVAEIAVPIRIEDAVAGVLFVVRRTAHPFSPADETILARLADQAAIAIANARLFQNRQQAYKELQQAQEELVRSEKLRGLGEMAAGIAHDLNNTLATVLGQAELLRLRVRQTVRGVPATGPRPQEDAATRTAANVGRRSRPGHFHVVALAVSCLSCLHRSFREVQREHSSGQAAPAMALPASTRRGIP